MHVYTYSIYIYIYIYTHTECVRKRGKPAMILTGKKADGIMAVKLHTHAHAHTLLIVS